MDAFAESFQRDLADLMRWRRDVRRFRTTPVDDAVLERCLATISYAPSVGLSQPWRLVRVRSETARAAVLANFTAANQEALAGYQGEQAARYATLRLAGIKEAPVQFAVFCDDTTTKGSGLGIATMPEMLRYSVVTAIHNLWLSTRAAGLGLGWVSILDPQRLAVDLDTPRGWHLVGYLCIGWPEETHLDPELERAGWERASDQIQILER